MYVALVNTQDMITDNEPLLTKYISVPRESSSLNCGAFVAGLVESVLDASQFVSFEKKLIPKALFSHGSFHVHGCIPDANDDSDKV